MYIGILLGSFSKIITTIIIYSSLRHAIIAIMTQMVPIIILPELYLASRKCAADDKSIGISSRNAETKFCVSTS